MNNETIEFEAITALSRLAHQTKYLKPEIPYNDKFPIWDGYIYRYTDKNFNNNSLSGRVPIQLKGSEVKEFDGDTMKYPIRVCDLNAYSKDGGAIFFVVQIKSNLKESKIYYRTLLPIDIEEIITVFTKEQKTITVELNTIGQRGMSELLSIIDFFLHHRLKLTKNGPRMASLEHGALINFTVFTTPQNALRDLLISPKYVFTTVNNIKNDIFYTKIYTKELYLTFDSDVIINNKTFFRNPKHIICRNHSIIQMGEILRYNCRDNLLVVDFKGGVKLDLNTCNFLYELKKTGYFSLGRYTFQFNKELLTVPTKKK